MNDFLCKVLGGRVRQLQAALKIYGLELRALREVLGGRIRQVPAAFKIHVLELQALREVLGGRVRPVPAVCKIRGLLRLYYAVTDRFITAGEPAPDRECLVLLK